MKKKKKKKLPRSGPADVWKRERKREEEREREREKSEFSISNPTSQNRNSRLKTLSLGYLGYQCIIKIMQRVRNTVVELYELLNSFIVCKIKTIESSKLKNMRFHTYKRSLICKILTMKIFSAVLSLLATN